MTSHDLLLDAPAQTDVWRAVLDVLARYDGELANGGARAVLPTLSSDETRALVASFDFLEPMAPRVAVDRVARGLGGGQVHVAHPRYFGLFNPAPTTMSVAADALVAAFNPQLATHGHAPFAAEVERHLLHAFAERLGFARAEVEGVFTSGGAEANTTAMLAALVRAFPAYADDGARALASAPRVYASAEAHHSLEKAARMTGLGSSAVRRVPVDAAMRMKPDALSLAIARDRSAGDAPFLIVATLGTTSAGAVDPIAAIAKVAVRESCWLHVDAAWGGGFAAIVPELSDLRDSCGAADSITVDAHKSLSVPMGAGMYLSRRAGALGAAFGVRAEYMPRDGSRDPYASSIQWSRRFTGLKLFLSLATAGWDGYASALRRQIALGQRLRESLASDRVARRQHHASSDRVLLRSDARGRNEWALPGRHGARRRRFGQRVDLDDTRRGRAPRSPRVHHEPPHFRVRRRRARGRAPRRTRARFSVTRRLVRVARAALRQARRRSRAAARMRTAGAL